jgi:histidyl-tRNA synthetase
MKQIQTQPVRGMRDILPQQKRLREEAFAKILHAYRQFGFSQIETPALENLDALLRSNAGDNTKLIFAIMKRGNALEKAIETGDAKALADLGLRFDLTLPLARYYAQNRSKLPRVFKSIQVGNVWRAERPQKGRYRQFYQCDIDVIGNASILAEIELLAATARALMDLGFVDFTIRVNDRRILSALTKACHLPDHLSDAIFIILDKLDKIGLDKMKQELMALELKEASVDALLTIITSDTAMGTSRILSEHLVSLEPFIAPEIIPALEVMIHEVNASSDGKFQCIFDPTLVRGLGYYTGTIFEITYKDYPSSIAGGGRYDNMISNLVNVNVPACGMSIGFDRMMNIVEEEELLPLTGESATALIYDKQVELSRIMSVANELRGQGEMITLYQREKNFAKQLTDLATNGMAEYYALNERGELSPLRSMRG